MMSVVDPLCRSLGKKTIIVIIAITLMIRFSGDDRCALAVATASDAERWRPLRSSGDDRCVVAVTTATFSVAFCSHHHPHQ